MNERTPAESEHFLTVVDSLYDSVLHPERLDNVCSRLGEISGANLTVFLFLSTDQERISAHDYGADAVFARYMNDWAGHDGVLHRIMCEFNGETLDMETLQKTEKDVRAEPAFDGFYATQDLVNAVGHFRMVAPGWIGGMSMFRGARDGAFTSADHARVDALAPHIERALSLSLRLQGLEKRSAAGDGLLRASGLTAIACTTDGRLLECSPEADRALRTRSFGLTVRHGRVTADDLETERRLNQSMHRVHLGGKEPSEFRVGGPNGCTAWCTVMPMPTAASLGEGCQDGCLLVIHRPADLQSVTAERVARALALSPSKADVLAGLMQGSNLETIAQRKGTSVETVRSYLKELRHRLDCHSQAELVAHAWRAIATIPDLAPK